jgi:hypothetical protein
LRPNRDGDTAFTLAGTVQTNPSALSPVAHSTERSQPDNEDEDDLVSLIQSLNHRTANLGVRVVQELFPPVTSRLQRNRQILLDPPMVGAENNFSFSSLQLNITSLTQSNLSSLGYSGNTHTDMHDDPMSLTVLICVSNLMSGTYPGTFYLGETREWCEMNPFSLLLFRGTGPHGGAQAIAAGDPDESEKRINLILYPRKEFVNRTVDIFYPWSPARVADYSFFDDGAASFGSDEYHKSWCTREFFRHMIAVNKEYGVEFEDTNLQQAFTALTGSTARYIDPESPEALDIKNSIMEGNRIMESVRPTWVREEPENATESTPLRRTTRKRPTRQSDQSAASTNPVKRTRVGSQPASEPRRSTRVTRSVATMSTQPAVSPSHSASDREIVVTKTPPHLGEDVIGDSRFTMVGTTASSNSTSVVELLQMQPLFEVSTMKEQIRSIREKAKLLASKFTKRSPLLTANFAPKRLALPPPQTHGIVIVERLIQLAEPVHWLTQKSEHLWFYQSALDEHYAHKLMQVAPLFDHDALVSIFAKNDRNQGAGLCSRALMDKIVSMVNNASRKQETEVVVFDPKELFGRRYQPKFCATVEVTVKPFQGRDAYAHMAHHFREVLRLWFED